MDGKVSLDLLAGVSRLNIAFGGDRVNVEVVRADDIDATFDGFADEFFGDGRFGAL